MNVAIIGTGYVGLPTGVGLAELGHNVICIDREVSKIKALKDGKITLYEEGLEELFHKNVKEKRLIFSTSMKEGVENADIVMIAVGTPPHPVTKEADMKYIYAAATELAPYLKDYTLIATKSTVPVGTGDSIQSLISKKNKEANFDVVSLPEFLREGFAVYDFFNPDRIIVGVNDDRAKPLIEKLYERFKDKILFVSRYSAETIKYASNSFLAIKVHFINEMADFCEKTGADILEVAKGMGLDTRIGSRFLRPGPGYGGSCFPKDTLAMSYMARQNELDLSLVNAAINGNELRKERIANKITQSIKDKSEAKIGILGLAFKDGTDDCRESPAIDIIAKLLEKNLKIKAYDPKAMSLAKELLQEKIEYAKDMYECVKDVDVLVILTEWQSFKELDLKKAKELMSGDVLLDFRNLLDKNEAVNTGFKYSGVGR